VTRVRDQIGAGIGLGAVLLLALGLRVGWCWRLPVTDAAIDALPDQRGYLSLGQNLLAGRGLEYVDPRFSGTQLAYRTPGYPLLIAACGASVKIVRLVQAAIDTSTVLAVYLIARKWLSPRLSVFAAAIVAINPYLIYFSGLILTETLFTAMLAWGMALMLISGGPWAIGAVRRVAWLSGGLLLALSILVRPVAIVLPALLGLVAAFANHRNLAAASPYDGHGETSTPPSVASPWPLPVAATMLILTALVLSPWIIRNEIRLHAFVWSTTNDGITLYDGLNPDASGASDQTFVSQMPLVEQMDETSRSVYLSDQARRFAVEHPVRVLQLAAIKLLRTWSPVPLSAQYGSKPMYVMAGLAYSVPLMVLSVLGLASRLPGSAKTMLVLPAVYLSAAGVVTVGSLRYRMPAEPPMAVLAAAVGRRSRESGIRSQESGVRDQSNWLPTPDR
jgi:Dolichyl-phosphate-mannose-protein mannosyltransferase